MADINYFLEPKSWKVTAGSGPLSQILPAKGSSVRIEEQPNGSVEQDKAKGKKGLKGKVERPAKPKGVKPLPGRDMTGTWGAETNPGSGSGGGGKQGDCQ